MPPTYLLPVITTKEQIGLSNVTNDEQLKKTSNLEDIDNAALARTNLGLGTSATKDVGTGSGDVAAGDHDHEGVYAPVLGEDDNYVTDAEKTKLSNLSGENTGDQDLSGYSLITHHHIEDDITDLDKYSQSDIDLILKRLKGMSLTQNDLQYMYNHNTKLIATCEADESWADGNHIGTYVATHADDTTNNKVGSQGISITTTSITYKAIHLEISKDLSEFEDGSESTEDDYIEFSIYCADASKIGDSNIIFRDATGDVWYPSATLTIVDGWNHYQIKKSDFISGPIWNDTKHLEFTITSTDGTEVSYTIDAIRMTRKDPIDSEPNPFQIENDGVMERVLQVKHGVPFLGYDGSDLVVKTMDTVIELWGTFYYGKWYYKASFISTAALWGFIAHHYDNNNYASAGCNEADKITKSYKIGGVLEIDERPSFPVNAGDEIELVGNFVGSSFFAYASKTGASMPLAGTGSDSFDGVVRIQLYGSLTSFKCSSSSGMVSQ